MNSINCIANEIFLPAIKDGNWKCLLLGVGIMLVLTVVIKLSINLCLYKRLKKPKDALKKFFRLVIEILLSIPSIDYCITTMQKRRLKVKIASEQESKEGIKENDGQESNSQSNVLGDYIKRNNHWNLIASVLLVVVGVFLWCVGFLWIVIVGLLGYRTLSRTMEINISFLRDIMDKSNNSDLQSIDRIKLAIKSLLEETILFFAFYLVLNKCYDIKYFCSSIIASTRSIIPTIPDAQGTFVFVVATYQAISAFILITLSIAMYISRAKDTVKKDV